MNTGTTSFIFRRFRKKKVQESCNIGGLMTHLFFQNQELLVFRSWERLQASVPPKIIRASVRMIAQEPHVQCHAALATWIHNAVAMWVSPSTQAPWYHFLTFSHVFFIRRAQVFREVNQLWSHLPRAVSSGFSATSATEKRFSIFPELKMGRRCHGVSQIVK